MDCINFLYLRAALAATKERILNFDAEANRKGESWKNLNEFGLYLYLAPYGKPAQLALSVNTLKREERDWKRIYDD